MGHESIVVGTVERLPIGRRIGEIEGGSFVGGTVEPLGRSHCNDHGRHDDGHQSEDGELQVQYYSSGLFILVTSKLRSNGFENASLSRIRENNLGHSS
ncbi:hypothetical protein [Natronorubrum thiooxidans]|uniref:Uncharacterized protein n=1 Tax=Natronorubrum thiooxidans TaxID=308853 RepID=A0A1N7G908_9EURY|nr:hypothetical protein [Natronorubrum thiooxidans]SIS09051.1 hypothetical protein SAMN05421752_110128 [Natronorubrum thiooxidans]